MGSRQVVRGFVVTGIVQGVGFRWWTRETAQRLGLSGWVRNRPGGEVEVHATGPEDLVAELERALARGPSGSRVDSVARLESAEGAGAEPGFVIRFE
ncbi:MAG: acylphosphatase [Gemmatimonadota bacterium]|nr:acylphosphatase [Gemmatimonadota bacterium]